MKMIPPVVAATTDSPAERKLFPVFERTELDKNAVCLHSIDLPDHEYKRMSEIDFVVLTRAGLLVCEVKGGLVTRELNGMWTFTNRHGEANTKPEGPFKQAGSAMWSLHADLKKRLDKAIFDQISFGWCVILPDCEFRDDSVDSPAELLIDRGEIAGARELAGPLARLLGRWQKKNRLPDMSAEALDRTRNAIRGAFDPVSSLATRARGIGADLQTLTEEQYAGLDWVEETDRLLISGGAGTGKTLLALEMARRDALRGRTVLLTCHSPLLARFLSARAPADVKVASLDEAGRIMQERNAGFDVVIVDEAQDVFTLEGVAILDSLVAGGIEEGTWRCFYDLNNQAGLFGEFDPDAFGLLSGTQAHTVALRRNCRNTKPIVLQTQSVTGADLGVPMAGDGPSVTFVKPADVQEETRMLAAELERLATADVASGSITILTGSGSAPSPADALDPAIRKRMLKLDAAVAGAWPVDRITVTAIEEFKGMENDFVLVCGLSGIDESRIDRARLYVAMSRARIGLWMAIPADLSGRFDALRRENMERALAAGKVGA